MHQCMESYTNIPALNNGYGKYAYSYSLLMEHALRLNFKLLEALKTYLEMSGTYLTYVADTWKC